MISFAERLAARGAGRLPGPGYVLARPRPPSRFEAPPTVGLETADFETPADPTATGWPSPARPVIARGEPPPRQAHSTDHLGDAEHRSGPVHSEADRAFSQRAVEPAFAEHPRSEATHPGMAVTTPFEAATQAPADNVAIGRMGLSVAPLAEPPRAAPALSIVEIAAPASAVPFADAAPARQAPPAETPEPAEIAPPVAVSIGRIDVQFLAPPSPAPSAPQRTRGFASYGRARLGHPR